LYKNKFIMLRILSFVLLVTLVFTSKFSAQIVVANTLTPEQIVNQVLLGGGVTATNITYQGATGATTVQNNVATYSCPNNATFPIQSGILLTTGNALGAVGPNNSTGGSNFGSAQLVDADLTVLANTPPPPFPASITNGVIIEFDFVPQGDSIKFNYLFGSEEYPEFAPPGGALNDVFGFFLSGPGINGPYTNNAVNIAVLPNSPINTQVSIQNVNPVTNSGYYLNNLAGTAWGSALQYDGTTTLLKAKAAVQCGLTYHIKMAITNVQDQGWDSGVLLQAGSFSSNLVQVVAPTTVNSSITNDSLTAERCERDTLYFIRPSNTASLAVPLTLPYVISGTATNGVDYTTLPGSVTFPVGVDTVAVYIIPTIDNLTEGIESIYLTLTVLNACGIPVSSTASSYLYDAPVINLVAPDGNSCGGVTVPITASASNSFGPYTYSWNTNPVQTTATANLASSPVSGVTTTYIVTATDACGYTQTENVIITTNLAPVIDSMRSQPTNGCGIPYTGVVQSFNTYASPPNPLFQWNGPGVNGPIIPIQGTTITDLPGGWYYFKITNAQGCFDRDSVFVNQTNVPTASFTATPGTGVEPLNVVFSNTSTNAVNYTWNFGNGTFIPTTSTADFSQTYTYDAAPNGMGTYNVCLIATLAGGACPDTVCHIVQVDTIVPSPIIPPVIPPVFLPLVWEIGNIFTPDGDNINEVFGPKLVNAKDVKLTIFNRWGNIVYKGSGVTSGWDGKSGNEVIDGVYFYKIIVYGYQNEVQESQGFVQVIRK
jgi:gliding motility-associated-like protein